MDDEEGVKKTLEEPVRGRRSRGRQRIRWRDKVKDDMERRGLVEEDAFDKNRWRRYVRQPTPYVGIPMGKKKKKKKKKKKMDV